MMEGRLHTKTTAPACRHNSPQSQKVSPYFEQDGVVVQKSTQEDQPGLTQLLESLDKMHELRSSMQIQLTTLTEKLKVSENTREQQHQNILGIQGTTEQISICHNAEVKNREALTAKLANTQTVCNILHSNCQILSTTMQKCVTEKDKLKEEFDRRSAQIYDLESNYAGRQELYKVRLESLETSLSKEQQKNKEDLASLENGYELLKEQLLAQLSQEQVRLDELEKELVAAKNQIEQMEKAGMSATQQYSKQLDAEKEAFHLLSCSTEEQQILLRDAQRENACLKIIALDKERLEDELMKAMNRISQISAEVEKLRMTEEELNTAIQSMRQEMGRMKLETYNSVAQLEGQNSNLRLELEKMEMHHAKEVSDVMGTLDEAQNQASIIQARLQLQFGKCQAECKTIHTQGMETENILQNELQVASEFVTQLRQQIRDITEKYHNTKMQFDKDRKYLEHLIEEHDAAKQQMAKEITQAYEELKKSHKLQHKEQAAAALKEQVLHTKVLKEQCCVRALQININILLQKQSSAESAIAKKEKVVIEVHQELEKLREMFQDISQKVKGMEEAYSELKRELSVSSKCIQSSEDQIFNLKQTHQLLEHNLQSEQGVIHDLKTVISTRDDEKIRLEKLLNESKLTCEEFKNKNDALRQSIEFSEEKSEEYIQHVKDQFHFEISSKSDHISVLQLKIEAQECRLLNIQKKLEKIDLNFQDKLTAKKSQAQEQLQIKEEESTEILAKKDDAVEDLRQRLIFSNQQLNHAKEQVAVLQNKLSDVLKGKDTTIISIENDLKLHSRDLDGFTKSSEDGLLKNTELTNRLRDVKNNYHQTRVNFCNLTKKYNNISAKIHQHRRQLKVNEIRLKQLQRSTVTSKSITNRIQSEFSTYEMERKRKRLEAVRQRSRSYKSTPYPSASRSPQTRWPQTPTRSILKGSKTHTLQATLAPKQVKFAFNNPAQGN